MSEGALAATTAPRTYAELRRRVEDTLLMGQRRIEEAKIRTYWETGRLIDQHLLVHKDRAHYGGQVIPRLADDSGINARILYQCVQFARAFPILNARSELSWAHYRALAQVGDKTQRKVIEVEAARNNWTSRELEQHIRPIGLAKTAPVATSQAPESRPKVLVPKRGTIGVYQIVPGPDALAVDLGFTSYLNLTPDQARGLKLGSLVRLESNGRIGTATGAKVSDLFTYPAEVLRVVDGDTLWMRIYLRPRHWLKEKLRLRGIDCPEMDTPKASRRKTLCRRW